MGQPEELLRLASENRLAAGDGRWGAVRSSLQEGHRRTAASRVVKKVGLIVSFRSGREQKVGGAG